MSRPNDSSPTMELRVDVRRMSHTADPDTSKDAAVKAKRGRKVIVIQKAILMILAEEPRTCREVHKAYKRLRKTWPGWPKAKLQDIRRRMTELKKDTKQVVDSQDRRNGEAVMCLRADPMPTIRDILGFPVAS